MNAALSTRNEERRRNALGLVLGLGTGLMIDSILVVEYGAMSGLLFLISFGLLFPFGPPLFGSIAGVAAARHGRFGIPTRRVLWTAILLGLPIAVVTPYAVRVMHLRIVGAEIPACRGAIEIERQLLPLILKQLAEILRTLGLNAEAAELERTPLNTPR